MSKGKRFLINHLAWILLLLLCAVYYIFLGRLEEMPYMVMRQALPVGVMAAGMMFVLIVGNVDFSAGAQSFAACAIFTWCWNPSGLGLYDVTSLVISLGAVLVFGFLGALAVGHFRIPSFASSLGIMYTVEGLALLLLGRNVVEMINGQQAFPFSLFWYSNLGVWVICLAVFMTAAFLILRFTRFGSLCRAVGTNPKAARLSGIPVFRIRCTAYMLCSVFAAFSGMIQMGLNRGTSLMAGGLDTVIDVLAACAAGGISFAGGKGKVSGLAGGVLLICTVNNMMTRIGVNVGSARLIKGLLLLVFAALDMHFRKKAGETLAE